MPAHTRELAAVAQRRATHPSAGMPRTPGTAGVDTRAGCYGSIRAWPQDSREGAAVRCESRAPVEVGGYGTAAGSVPIGGMQRAERGAMAAVQRRMMSMVCLQKRKCASERRTVSSVSGGAGGTHLRLSSLSSRRPVTLPPRRWEPRPRPSAHRRTYFVLMASAAVDRAESPACIP